MGRIVTVKLQGRGGIKISHVFHTRINMKAIDLILESLILAYHTYMNNHPPHKYPHYNTYEKILEESKKYEDLINRLTLYKRWEYQNVGEINLCIKETK